MLIVVEGMDRTGKSSLCAELTRLYGGETIHFSAPKQGAIEEYVTPLRAYKPGTGQNLYLDRHYLGETVWPSFFGRRSVMSRTEREVIEVFLEGRGALCVLATRDEVDLERACVEASEPSAGRAARAQQMFRETAQRSIVPWMEYQHGDDVGVLATHAMTLEDWAADRLRFGE